MREAITTSIRMPLELREQLDIVAQASKQSRNEVIVDALRSTTAQRLREIALIQEGIRAADEGRTHAIDDVIAEFKRDGLLPADFVLDDDGAQATA